jgi:predicted amidohydrolase
MRRSLRATALQLRAHDRAAFRDVRDAILERVEYAARGADLVVLPEGTIPAYVLGDDYTDNDDVARALDALADLAKRTKTVVVAGAAVRHEGELYNAGIVIDSDGSVAGRADKIFLWHFDRRWFSPGKRLAPIETSLGRLGVLVCADGRMPGIAAGLVDRGAEILVMPTAWVSSGRDPDALENPIADLLGRLRAYENGVPFVAANKCGVEREMVLYCGKSQIVSADGEVVAIAGEREPCEVSCALVLGDPSPRRSGAAGARRREAPTSGVLRVAVSASTLPADIDERLRLLEAGFVVAPDAAERLDALDAALPVALVDDAAVRDPYALSTLRRMGYRLFVWRTRGDDWTERLARARAGETRCYVVVLDEKNGRAFVVDPDYAIVCGTFDGYRIASCAIDVAKTAQTVVVPGTDVAEGLERVHDMANT